LIETFSAIYFLEVPGDRDINDYAFAHFDIKQFRVINEAYGHIAANKVLNNIVKAMNEADFVYASARCHNDNFAMILKDMPDQELEQKLRELFERGSVLEEDPHYKVYYKCGVVPMRRAMLSGNRVADAAKMAQALCTKLMNVAKEQAKLQNGRAIILETQSCNVRAISFYRSQGFELIGYDACCYTNHDIARHEIRFNFGFFMDDRAGRR